MLTIVERAHHARSGAVVRTPNGSYGAETKRRNGRGDAETHGSLCGRERAGVGVFSGRCRTERNEPHDE